MREGDDAAFWWDWFLCEGGLARGVGMRPPAGRIGPWYRDHPQAFAEDVLLGWIVRHPACAPAVRLAGLPVAEECLPAVVRTARWVEIARSSAQYPVWESAQVVMVAAGPGTLDPEWAGLAGGRRLLRWAAAPAELQAQDRIFARIR